MKTKSSPSVPQVFPKPEDVQKDKSQLAESRKEIIKSLPDESLTAHYEMCRVLMDALHDELLERLKAKGACANYELVKVTRREFKPGTVNKVWKTVNSRGIKLEDFIQTVSVKLSSLASLMRENGVEKDEFESIFGEFLEFKNYEKISKKSP
jgi:hypothetical protein